MKQPSLYVFNGRKHFRRFLWGLIGLVFFTGLGLITAPEAHAASFSCNGATPVGNIFVHDTQINTIYDAKGNPITISAGNSNIPNTDPYASGACSEALGPFGRVLCFFRTAVGQIISTMLCNFQNELLGPLSILAVLVIATLGIMFITGMTHLNAREASIALLKIAIVWAFATNPAWSVGIGYAFFMGLAEQGTDLVLGAIDPNTGGGNYLSQPDQILGSIFSYATIGSAGGHPITWPSTLTTFCALMLFTLFALLLFALPMVGGAILAMILQYIWLYARAFLGFLTALVLIGFLFVPSGIFICFSLFQTTRPLFEKWLQYLATFALQMVIVFAFLALLNLIPIGDFFIEILSLVRQYDTTWSLNQTSLPVMMCSICPYTINSSLVLGGGGGSPITCSSNTAIPLSQIFTAQDLVQAIVAQAVAIGIVGKIMLDYVKKAPETARELTGRLSSAALLGGSAAGISEGTDIRYPGMDALEQGIEGLQNKLRNPATYQGWKRVLPAGLLTAPAYASLFRRSGTQQGSVPEAQPGTWGPGVSNVTAAAQAKAAEEKDKKDKKTKLAGVRRAGGPQEPLENTFASTTVDTSMGALGLTTGAAAANKGQAQPEKGLWRTGYLFSIDDAREKYLQAESAADKDAKEVQETLTTVKRMGAGQSAGIMMASFSGSYGDATNALWQKTHGLLDGRLKLYDSWKNISERNRAITEGLAMEKLMPMSEMQGYVSKQLISSELVLEVQQQLSLGLEGRVKSYQESLQRAHQEFQQAQDQNGLDKVMKTMYEADKKLADTGKKLT